MSLIEKVATRYIEALGKGYPEGRGPATPWGPAQQVYPILRGLRWVSTASHGGVAISDGLARQKLSPTLYRMGDRSNGYVWFEEDVAWVLPFYENPDWLPYLQRATGGSLYTQDGLLKEIEQRFPQYLAKVKAGDKPLLAKPQVGQSFEFNRDVSYGRIIMPKGQLGTITRFTGSSIVFSIDRFLPNAPGKIYRMPKSFWDNGTVTPV